MYLLVFTTLMIAVIGLFTEVTALQTARFASNQSGIGSALLQWHAAAVSMAASIIKTNPGAYTLAIQTKGCSLTATPPPGTAMAPCPSPNLYAYGAAAQTGTVTNGGLPSLVANATAGKNECVHLSSLCTVVEGATGCPITKCKASYDAVDYQFYSILYQDAGTHQDLVVTFLPAPVPAPPANPKGYLSTVNGTVLGITTSDLLRQLNNAGAPNYTYGSFNFTGAPQLATNGNVYNLPSTGGFPNLCNASACLATGAVAVIGSPDGF